MATRMIVESKEAPQAIGPYSQAVCTDYFIFVSGQIPLDAASGDLVEGDVSVQARQVLENVRAVLEEAGSSLAQVVKTTVFLADMGDFATVNAIYGEYFPHEPPARSAIEVAALPRGARVEIEVIALRQGGSEQPGNEGGSNV